jgi:hypothetical protein
MDRILKLRVAMNPVTVQQGAATLYTDGRVALACESQLRVAAAMLARGNEISATTVVGELRLNQWAEFDARVAEIADEYGLEARLHVEDGRFSVRFSLPTNVAEQPARNSGAPSWLLRLLPGLRNAT